MNGKIRIEPKDWDENRFARSKSLIDVLREPVGNFVAMARERKDENRQTQIEVGEVVRCLGEFEEFFLVKKEDGVIGWCLMSDLEVETELNGFEESPSLKLTPNQFFEFWAGTPYLWGGITEKGIDCSAFTQRYYRDVHDLQIPKNSFDQRKFGRGKNLAEIDDSDLIFCHHRELSQTHHVGVFFEKGVWHANFVKGVIRQSFEEFVDNYKILEVVGFEI